MPGYKVASNKPKPKNWKRAIDGAEIKPTLFVKSSGRKIIGGSVNGEIVLNDKGEPVPFKAIQHTELL